MEKQKKRILLIDSNDLMRGSRVRLLSSAGYLVDLRDDSIAAERLDHEREFDIVIIALHGDAQKQSPVAIT